MNDFLKRMFPTLLAVIQLFSMTFSGRLIVKKDNFSADLEAKKRSEFRAEVLSDSYLDNFWFPQLRLLSMSPRNGEASCWEYCGLLSLGYKLTAQEKMSRRELDKIIDGLMYYRKESNGKFAGYAVGRAKEPLKAEGSVSYDDDMWLARDFVALYELTNDAEYLKLATEIADFIIAEGFAEIQPRVLTEYGFSVEPGAEYGGFFWNDGHDALHTCSNSPAVQFLAALYRLTGNETYLSYAKKSWNFVKYLESADGVFYDLMRFHKDENEKIIEVYNIDEAVYSYNSGASITAAVELYRATGGEGYLNDAKRMAASADSYFARESGIAGVKNYIDTNTWFNLILLNGFISLAPYSTEADRYIANMQASIDYAYDNYRTEPANALEGTYIPFKWIDGWESFEPSGMWALNVSAAAEIYATLAMYYR